MSTEPKWPSDDDVEAEVTRRAELRLEWSYSGVAIEMCRAAWLAANDDPSKSPIGEVRSHLGHPVIRAAHAVGLDREPPHYPWTLLLSNGHTAGFTHANVTGCAVIGQVPGTPAAEAQS